MHLSSQTFELRNVHASVQSELYLTLGVGVGVVHAQEIKLILQRHLCHSTDFFYRSTSATVQMLKLQKVGEAKSRQ